MKLTKKQTEHLNDLKERGPCFVGHKFTVIMRTFDILVTKGFAQVIKKNVTGKEYAIVPNKD